MLPTDFFKFQKRSKMVVEDSVFRMNGRIVLSSSIFLINNYSSLTVKNSNFNDNSAIYGACFSASGNTVLIVKNSTFSHNGALKGGVFYYADEEDITNRNSLGQDFHE